MILGVIADDFTGAGDIALILAKAGMRTALLPTAADVADCVADAGVVALKSRSVPADQAMAASLEALAALRAAGCQQFVFKYCSTFDSTPEGNIGPVAAALADALDANGVIVCPAFPANGRRVFQGNLFVGDTPLAESGMRHHPVTPMCDSDIRRWLRRQTDVEIGHVPLERVRQGSHAVEAELSTHRGLVVVDAVEDDDLAIIAKSVRGAKLVTGGSAIAQGLARNMQEAGSATVELAGLTPVVGTAIVLAGSCSETTGRQVESYDRTAPIMALDVDRLVAGEPVYDECRDFLIRHGPQAPLVYSTAPADRLDKRPGASELIEGTFARLAVDAVGRGVTRLVVAGGETSGAVVEALAPGPLEVAGEIAPGVPSLVAGELRLALKSGNFGNDSFFSEALRLLDGGS